MINGLLLHVPATEIVAHLDRRIARLHTVVGKLEEERAAIEKLPHSSTDRVMRSYPEPKMVQDRIESLTFIRDHLQEDEIYVLDHSDLLNLEFVLLDQNRLLGGGCF